MDVDSSGASPSRSDDQANGKNDRIYALFAAALELAAENRAAFLERACSGDATLQCGVERLLATEASTKTSVEKLARPQFATGKELASRFRIVRFIASGGMSDVYEAQDLELGERVALKTIRPEVVGDAGSLARFKREIQYAKRVTHPNVCRIHDLGSHRQGGTEIVFLTMELVQGRTLAAALRDTGRMTAEEALPIVMGMTEALAAAHDAGIIHRDFKTSNVMIADGKAIVTDFGLARATGSSDEPSLTEVGKLVGTLAYMAPEQLTHSQLTAATDVYALGW